MSHNRIESTYIPLLNQVDEEIVKTINSSFDLQCDKLPSRKIIHDSLKKYSFGSLVEMKLEHAVLIPHAIRELYLEHAFIAYNHELLSALKTFCENKNMKSVHELCCGTGWFSHWMRKYGIPLKEAVDNKTWGTYQRADNFLPIVKQEDAVSFVKRSPDADMFVLSWPWMDPLAYKIWNAMKPGQYLLYIGEGMGGCTANDDFFNAVSDKEITDDADFNKIAHAFVQFQGLHDRPELYKK